MKSIAVVGCGQWGKNLVRNFSQLGVLGAVCDPQVEETYGAKVLTWEDIMEDPSLTGVVLAVPASLHVRFAQEALERGKHIFLEKPIAFCAQDVKRLEEKAKNRGLIFMGGHILRYHPAFVLIQQKVESGTLGKLLFVDATRKSFGRVVAEERTAFWSLAPHDVSLVLALAGHLPQRVTAQAESVYTPADQGIAHLFFSQGMVARIFTSWISPYKQHQLVVTGTQGSLVWNQSPLASLLYYPHAFHAYGIVQEGLPERLDYDPTEPLRKECQAFLGAIGNQEPPITHGVEGYQVTQVLQEIHDALEDSRPT